MKVKDVTRFLETWAPRGYQESYDNSGLIVGNANAEVTGVIVSLDSTEAVVDDAISRGCNLIVAHHPIVFSGLKTFTGKNYIERTVMKAIRNDVAIYAIHTNLDNVADGVNKEICDRLNLLNTKILASKSNELVKLVVFVPKDKAEVVRAAMFNAGAGSIGNYDECSFNLEGTGTFRAGAGTDPYVGNQGEQHQESEVRIETIVSKAVLGKVLGEMIAAHPYEEVAYDIYPLDNKNQNIGSGMVGELEAEVPLDAFLNTVKTTFKCGVVRYTDPTEKTTVKKVAVCGGSGSFLLGAAKGVGADIFITSDYKYHQFFDADGQIVIADIGHYESEQFTIDLIHRRLTEKFTTFAVHFTQVETNPVNYL